MEPCTLCPRNCGVLRPLHCGGALPGFCQSPQLPVIARAALHAWEEPCISGSRGSGTVFFSGCNMHCVFCQNSMISLNRSGQEVSVSRLREIYDELISQGAHNINLVTPTHYAKAIAESLSEPLPVPVIYNCGGYESLDTLKMLEGKIQIFLPDFKYWDNTLAKRYSRCPDYRETAIAAIEEMFRQRGAYQLDGEGMLISGVVIRHLILPGALENTKRVIDWVANRFDEGQVLFSLMRQYVPCGQANRYPELNRRLTADEYQEAETYLFSSSIEDGFVQEEGADERKFIPAFDGTGVTSPL